MESKLKQIFDIGLLTFMLGYEVDTEEVFKAYPDLGCIPIEYTEEIENDFSNSEYFTYNGFTCSINPDYLIDWIDNEKQLFGQEMYDDDSEDGEGNPRTPSYPLSDYIDDAKSMLSSDPFIRDNFLDLECGWIDEFIDTKVDANSELVAASNGAWVVALITPSIMGNLLLILMLVVAAFFLIKNTQFYQITKSWISEVANYLTLKIKSYGKL